MKHPRLQMLFLLTSALAALDETSILDICRVVLKSRGWMTSGPLALAWATDSNLRFHQAAVVDVRLLEHAIGGASIAGHLSNVRLLEHAIGEACIAGHVSSVRVPQHAIAGASDGASIHRCQPGNVRFLEASDGASIHLANLVASGS